MPRSEEPAPPSLLASILPALACAVCPACIASYATALSALGISATLGEEYHHYFLAVAVLVTIGVHAHRAWRSKRIVPLAIAVTGCGLLVGGHALGESSPLVWAGVVVLLGGSVLDVLVQRRQLVAARASSRAVS